MVPINTIPFFIALLVTGIPLAVGPATVLLIEFSGDQHGGYEGLVILGAILTMGIIASASRRSNSHKVATARLCLAS